MYIHNLDNDLDNDLNTYGKYDNTDYSDYSDDSSDRRNQLTDLDFNFGDSDIADNSNRASIEYGKF
jgi:hypothetical protein